MSEQRTSLVKKIPWSENREGKAQQGLEVDEMKLESWGSQGS